MNAVFPVTFKFEKPNNRHLIFVFAWKIHVLFTLKLHLFCLHWEHFCVHWKRIFLTLKNHFLFIRIWKRNPYFDYSENHKTIYLKFLLK